MDGCGVVGWWLWMSVVKEERDVVKLGVDVMIGLVDMEFENGFVVFVCCEVVVAVCCEVVML